MMELLRRALIVVLLTLAATPARGIAQVVRGEVRAENDAAPVAHVFVLLLDADGNRVAGALTDSLGRFAMRAPREGQYRLRAERIGYGSRETDLVTVGPGTFTTDLWLPPSAVALVPLMADAAGRGCPRRRDGAAVQALWEDIRKVLHVTEWSQRSAGHRYTLLRYVRDLSADGATLLDEERNIVTLTASQPFLAASPHELASRGFVREEGGERVMLGPDATVLLSDAFLENHCFSMAPSIGDSLIGLAFIPLSRRAPPDIQGVLRVDRATRELRSLVFSYVNMPADLQRYGPGGEVRFHKLSDGTWLVRRWWIRTPLLGVRSRGGTELLGHREEGGVTVAALSGGADLLGPDGTGSITGVVTDSLENGRPLAGAFVFLSGAPHQAMTDESGRFELTGVPPGRHGLALAHPVLEGMDGERRLVQIDVRAGRIVQNLATPSRRTLYRTLCPHERPRRGTALLLGVVHDDAHAPVAGAEMTIAGAGDTRLSSRAPIRTGSDGRFHFCWLPENGMLALTLATENQVLRTDTLHLRGSVLRHDLELRRR